MSEDEQPNVIKRKRGISRKARSSKKEGSFYNSRVPLPLLLLSVSVAIVLGYLFGAYNNQIIAVVSPLFGIKTAGALDTKTLQETYNVLVQKYDGNLDTTKLIQGASRGMVEAVGDTYTTYMDSKEKTEFDNSLSGKIGGGVGAEIGMKDSKPYIVRTLKGYPAEKAGLQAGDIILGVNDQSTEGWNVEKTVTQIRGEAGTTVKISIKRGDVIKEYTITREVISAPSVDSSISGSVGTITISRFDSDTGTAARTAAEELKSQGAKSIILDLRGNGGGYVDAAVGVLGLWLNNQVVVTEKNATGTINEPFKTGNNAILAGMPTVVLVNSASASASEIVSGALKDHGVAKLVGENTYGKGCVQELISLSGGSQLKVTVANWYTPKNNNISKKGIAPDYVITLTQENVNNNIDPQMDKAKSLLNS